MQKQTPDNKNMLAAILLSVAVLLAWQVLYAGPKYKEAQERRKAEIEAQKRAAQTRPDGTQGSVPTPQAGAGAAPVPQAGRVPAGSGAVMSREAALKTSPRIKIENDALRGSISLRGGRIDDLKLRRFNITPEPGSPNVTLLSPAGSANAYFAEYGWSPAPGTSTKVPTAQTLWKNTGPDTLTADSSVTLEWDNGAGLVFKRIITVDKNYLFTVKDEVTNNTKAKIELYPYARIYRYGTPKIEGFFIQHEGLIGVLGEDSLQEVDYSEVVEPDGTKRFKQTGGWLGITDKYWSTVLIPEQDQAYTATMSGTPARAGRAPDYQADYLLRGIAIPAGGKGTTQGRLFAGAKKFELIQQYETQFKIQQFDLMVDWGWFYWITKPLFFLIDWLYKLLGNFGLAIVAVTILVKLAFFPLANKSYESMSRMKKLQPDMERIRDRYKDDKQAQQKALMELYRKEKINPLAGCLPILLQIPVFFALYKVLFISLEMRHAPFFGWINDLSAPDPTSIFNLFGLLPFSVPDFLLIGIWPLIMGATMWIQMQLNPQQPDPMQQRIFNWMPVLFTFLLASFPAGLVIYWAWNNVLSIIQQSVIMRKQGVEIPIWKNLGLERLLGKSDGTKSGG